MFKRLNYVWFTSMLIRPARNTRMKTEILDFWASEFCRDLQGEQLSLWNFYRIFNIFRKKPQSLNFQKYLRIFHELTMNISLWYYQIWKFPIIEHSRNRIADIIIYPEFHILENFVSAMFQSSLKIIDSKYTAFFYRENGFIFMESLLEMDLFRFSFMIFKANVNHFVLYFIFK